MDTNPTAAAFATTHWSVVLAAGGASTTGTRHAWEQLARAHWRPLYGHVRRRGRSHEDAQDLVQGFFTRLIEKPVLQQALRERGRFRTFLLAAFDHFLANEYDRASALKRGGGFEFVAWPDGEMNIEPAAPGVPMERQFDQEWAQTIFTHALGRLEQEFAQDGKQSQFAALAPFLSQPPQPGDYERIALEIGVRASLMATVVSRLRRRFRELVRAEIASTVATTAEVDAELSYLVELMAG
ncbi:MAG: sigma-70 family RNA polymerase sigma factor [Verrucomicrobia bacterium]|nr:sigma-70 family RNA polymerase sigma factor [Verrucomicrobiota bacterium]